MKRGFDTYFGYFVGDDDDPDVESPSNHGNTVNRSHRNKLVNPRVPRKFRGRGKIKKKRFEKSSSKYKKKSKHKLKKVRRKELKYDSEIYARKTVDIIRTSDPSQPFFIYLALFTKTYPREVRRTHHSQGSLQEAKLRDHHHKMEAMDRGVGDIVAALQGCFT